MKINPTIFRAYDIRGIYQKDLTLESVKHIGKAIATRLLKDVSDHSKPTIAVGRDGRLSGAKLNQSLCQGILSTGCNVVDIGLVPSPLVYYAGKKISNGHCIMITGSHNPPEYNGFKIVLGHTTLSSDGIQEIGKDTIQENYLTGQGRLSHYHIQDDYINEICQQNQLTKTLRVVVDAGNGVAGEIAPKLLQKLGCEVIQLFCEIDGNFPNHHPDPSKPENLSELRRMVVQEQANIGIAYDGDGDRIGVIDDLGNVINADRLLMLYAEQVLQETPSSEILYDVKCTAHLPKWIEQRGGKATMCRTGHSFIKNALAKTNARLAGEMSGHIFFNDRWYGFDDALYATVRLLTIIARTNLSSSELFSRLPNSVNTPEINIPFDEGEHFTAMQKILKNAHFKEAKISMIDGLRVDFRYGWGLVRPSNTTPVLVLRFEADNEDSLNKIKRKFRDLLTPFCPLIPF